VRKTISQLNRWAFPRSYIRRNIARLNRERSSLRSSFRTSPFPLRFGHTSSAAETASGEDGPEAARQARRRALDYLENELEEFYDWDRELNDEDLLKKAKKIGVYLDQIDFTAVVDEDQSSRGGRYHRIGRFGNGLLLDEVRVPLLKAVRERESVYRKDRIDTAVKIIGALTGLIGVIGTVLGLFFAAM
jgi:hypothetical protein